MKIALVTPSPLVDSEVGAAARGLVPYLNELCELALFVEPGGGVGDVSGIPTAPLTEIDPAAHDRLLIPIGDEPVLAFLPRVVRALGGTVLLHDWNLFRLACADRPELLRGGFRGLVAALREGGLRQARLLARERRAAHDGGGLSAEARSALTLNRSIVRHADSFLVWSRAFGTHVVEERNARTAIGLLTAEAEADKSTLAREIVGHLDGFPAPRSTRGARVAFGAWKAAQRAGQRGANVESGTRAR
jgi:hypothetical protein